MSATVARRFPPGHAARVLPDDARGPRFRRRQNLRRTPYPQTIVEGQAGTGRYPQTTIVEGQTASMPFNTAASPFVANAIAAATQAPPPTLDDIRTQRAPQAEQQAQYHNGVVGGASAVARNPSLVASIVAARQCRGWIGSQVRYTNVSARHAGGAKSTLSSPEVPTQLQLQEGDPEPEDCQAIDVRPACRLPTPLTMTALEPSALVHDHDHDGCSSCKTTTALHRRLVAHQRARQHRRPRGRHVRQRARRPRATSPWSCTSSRRRRCRSVGKSPLSSSRCR